MIIAVGLFCFIFGALFCLSLYEGPQVVSALCAIFTVFTIFVFHFGEKGLNENFKLKFTTGQYKVIGKQEIVGEDTVCSKIIIDTTTNEEVE